MKYLAIFVVCAFAAMMVQAQTNIPQTYTYKHKQLNDSLKVILPHMQISKEQPLSHTMPILQLRNEGVKAGSSSMGDVYSMQTDQMPCLKPFETKDEMPNAINRKQILPVTPKGEH